ncbi:hypothetical protein Tco_0224048 [Tanacetum coccineum]
MRLESVVTLNTGFYRQGLQGGESILWFASSFKSLVYVDDIIFGSTKKELCLEFEKLMHDKFQMSSMGELTFSLDVKTASTPIDTEKPLLKDSDGDDVDVHLYRFQFTPKVSHSYAVKRIFRYLKGQPKLGLWYPRNSPFDLEAYSDSDFAGASLDRKSTTGDSESNAGLWARHIEYLDAKIPQSSGPLEKVGDEAIHKELDDRMERAAITASSLEAEQDNGNNNRTQSIATLNEPSP